MAENDVPKYNKILQDIPPLREIAFGEPLPLTQPSTDPRIRWHGGFPEDEELPPTSRA